MDIEIIQNKISELLQGLIEWSPKLIGASLLLFGGLWLVGKVLKIVTASFDRSSLSNEIKPFLLSIVSAALKIAVVLMAAGILGVETSSFVAMLAAIGFAVGMALQGSLGHIAAGILILIFKPYKVGDFITIGEHKGFVTGVQIISTILRTLDNETVIIPNGTAISDVIINSSDEDGIIRLNINIYMPYEEQFDKIQGIIRKALATCPHLQTAPEAIIGIGTFDTHSIVIDVKPYCLVEDYEVAYFETTQAVKLAFGKANIKVAYSEGVELGEIGA